MLEPGSGSIAVIVGARPSPGLCLFQLILLSKEIPKGMLDA